LVAVRNCDKVAVLGNSGVTECGPHDELVTEKGVHLLYHELWMKRGARGENEDEEEQKEKN
jgi:ABC-type multidrug transport system fused ATPase/permease subunit